jgi:hypothetical protein
MTSGQKKVSTGGMAGFDVSGAEIRSAFPV